MGSSLKTAPLPKRPLAPFGLIPRERAAVRPTRPRAHEITRQQDSSPVETVRPGCSRYGVAEALDVETKTVTAVGLAKLDAVGRVVDDPLGLRVRAPAAKLACLASVSAVDQHGALGSFSGCS